jgi:putative N-acetylmannosamine-6-phosphate epimerase
MAKFMLVKFSVMAEITDVDALREAALKKFDADDSTSDHYPDTADWHASEEGQEERRQVATQDVDALNQFVDPAKACELLDGVPGVKAVTLGSAVSALEGTTQHEARDTWANREGITWWPEARDALANHKGIT